MDNDKMIINKADFEEVVRQEVLKLRRIYFDMECEDYVPRCHVERIKRKGKQAVLIDADEWSRFDEWVGQCLGDLMTAREIIGKMKPVFDEYYTEYQNKHKLNFDDNVTVQLVSYDTDEFERVRDKFEDEYFKDIDGDEEPER